MIAHSSATRLIHRVVVIGAGSIGERHARCFQATGRVEVGLAEVNRDLAHTVASRYGITDIFSDIREAIDADYTTAVVATPASMHIPLSRQLAAAGVHLLIEKPLAVELDGAAELEVAVREADLIAAVAYVYRAHPALCAMRTAIRAGRFGRPVQIVAVSGQHFPTYRPAYRDTYYAHRRAGGGAVQDALTHVLNAGEWLVGPVTRLIADADHMIIPDVDVEDTVHVLTRHGSVMGSYSLNQHQSPNENTITVICERGTARWELSSAAWYSSSHPGAPWHTELASTVERDTLFTRQAEAFLDAVEGLRPPLCTLAEGVQTLHVNRAVLRSIDEQSWQDIRMHEEAPLA